MKVWGLGEVDWERKRGRGKCRESWMREWRYGGRLGEANPFLTRFPFPFKPLSLHYPHPPFLHFLFPSPFKFLSFAFSPSPIPPSLFPTNLHTLFPPFFLSLPTGALLCSVPSTFISSFPITLLYSSPLSSLLFHTLIIPPSFLLT